MLGSRNIPGKDISPLKHFLRRKWESKEHVLARPEPALYLSLTGQASDASIPCLVVHGRWDNETVRFSVLSTGRELKAIGN